MKGINVSYKGKEHSLTVKDVPVDDDPKNLQYYIFQREKYGDEQVLLYIIKPEMAGDGDPRLVWKWIAHNGPDQADQGFVDAIGEALERQEH